MKTFLTCIICLFHLSCISQDSLDVATLACQEDIWSMSWKVIGTNLRNHYQASSGVDLVEGLAAQAKIPENDIRSYLRIALNYGTKPGVEDILYRYPHYNRDSVASDFNRLVEAQLLEKDEERFIKTEKGKQILSSYWDEQKSRSVDLREIEAELSILYEVYGQVVQAALDLDDGFPNRSIHLRRSSWVDQEDSLSLYLKLENTFNDYIAFINDNAHYRYDRFLALNTYPQWEGIELDPLARELLSTVRNGRTYSQEKCENRGYWRLTRDQCHQAIQQLDNQRLITYSGIDFTQSERGEMLYKAAVALSDRRLYATWNEVSIEAYKDFKDALERVEAYFPRLD